MGKQDKKLHDMLFHRNYEDASTWDCRSCGEIIQTAFDGLSLDTLKQKQAEHECPNDVARAMLPHHVKRIEQLLIELGVRIEIFEDSYYSGSAELVLLDTKTGAELRLETGELG